MHDSLPYNPDVATIFYFAGFIESWGRVIEKICSALRKENFPMPEFTADHSDIMIEFKAPEGFMPRVNDGVTEKVTDNEKKVLSLLEEDPDYSMPMLASKIGVSRKSIAKYLAVLKEKGLIKRVGSDRKGYWKINNEIPK